MLARYQRECHPCVVVERDTDTDIVKVSGPYATEEMALRICWQLQHNAAPHIDYSVVPLQPRKELHA